MTDYSIKVAQAAGILGSTFAGGQITGISNTTLWVMLLPPRKPTTVPADTSPGPGTPISHLTHQWLTLYNRGKKVYPAIAAAASANFWYLAWALRDTQQHRACCYGLAAAATMGIMPFTLLAMKKVNDKLAAHATRDDAALAKGKEAMKLNDAELATREREDIDALDLLRRWCGLNLVRGMLPLVGAVIGVYATIFA